MVDVISTADNDFFLSIILFILILFILYYIYLFFALKLYKDLQKFIFHIKIFIYLVVLIVLFFVLIRQIVIFEIVAGDEEASILWVIFISLLFGFYLSVCFGTIGFSKKWIKYIVVIALIYISFSGYGYLGYRFIFNISLETEISFFFQEKVFETNTPQGIHFIFRNFVLLLAIAGLTFIIEGEKREK